MGSSLPSKPNFGETESAENSEPSTKRRNVMSNIYKTLFKNGEGSDVKIVALNRTWNLHRLYLSRSPYFYCMFTGPWIETTQKEITIVIEDENITVEALQKIFGFLYQDEIRIMPSEVVPILACATFFLLDDLINKCIQVMKENMNFDTVLQYCEAADLYSVEEIKNITLNWLYKNTFLHLATSPTHLRQASCNLMTKLISSHNLVVIEREFSLYLLLKQWVFLKESCSSTFENLSLEIDQYFRANKSSTPFLEKDIGTPYVKAFRALRLNHVLVHLSDLEIIESDNIIPADWLMPIYKMQWFNTVRVDLGSQEVSKEDFNRDCMRCGTVLIPYTQMYLIWKGFHYGIDIGISYEYGLIKLGLFQMTESDPSGFRISNKNIVLQAERHHLMYRICVSSYDEYGNIVMEVGTDIYRVALSGKEEITVLWLPRNLTFPALLSANFLLLTPP